MSVYEGHGVTLHHGDCLDVLRTLPDASVDSVVTDPPYGLEFMGKEWDKFRTDDPGTNRHRGERAGKHGETVGEVDESLPSRPSGVLFDKNKRQARGVSYGAGKRPTTNVCEGCGKRDQFRNPHPCPEGTAWRSEILNPHAAPPSSLAFQEWCTLWAAECLRVLKPGGHLLAFGGTRTWHRLACAVEDAGFEVRDSIAWLYGSGFPKSLDVSKAIDKRPGVSQHPAFAAHLAERRQSAGLSRADVSEHVVGTRTGACWNWEHHQFPEAKWWPALRDLLDLDEAKWGPIIAEAERQKIGVKAGNRLAVAPGQGEDRSAIDLDVTTHATPDAERWQGWGTALKPAFEPVVVARKPIQSTVAANVLAWGTGALNVDGCRIEGGERPLIISKSEDSTGILGNGLNGSSHGGSTTAGRWPANVVLDERAAAELDRQSGYTTGPQVREVRKPNASASDSMSGGMGPTAGVYAGGSGGASRFFPTFHYEAKAPTSERPRYKREGGSDNATTYGQMKKRECNVCGNRTCPAGGDQSGKPWPTCGHNDWSWVEQQSARDEFVSHPTVKPLDLMRWLVRLVTPPGGVVLEPFAGSGTTVEACIVEGFDCIAIEREADYLPLIRQRIDRRRDPVEALRGQAADLGLFDLLGGEGA